MRPGPGARQCLAPAGRQLLLCLVAGIAIGGFGYAIVGPYRAEFDSTLQAAFVTAVGVLLTGMAALFAARVGAEGATSSAEIAAEASRASAADDRAAARDAQLNDQKLGVLVDVVKAGDTYMQSVADQISRRQEMAAHGGDPEAIPPVGPTTQVRDAIGTLYLFAQQDTADAAWTMYKALTRMSRFEYRADRHRVGNDIKALPSTETQLHEQWQREYVALRTEFQQHARAEMGLPRLMDRSQEAPLAGAISSSAQTSS